MKRLDGYSKNMVDFHLVIDLIPRLSRLYFKGMFDPVMRLGFIQSSVLVGFGLTFKRVEDIAKELNMQVNQVLPLLNKVIKKFSNVMKTIYEKEIKEQMPEINLQSHINVNQAVKEDMNKELEETGKEKIKEIYHSGEK